MKLLFVFDGLGYGGIERVGVDYINGLVSRGHDVSVINLDPKKNEFVSQLNAYVGYYELGYPRRLSPECYCQLVKRIRGGRFVYPLVYLLTALVSIPIKIYSRMTIGSFDVAIAFSGHYNDLTFVANHFSRSRATVAWLHGCISSYLLVSDGFINLYNKIHNLVTLVDDGNEEFAYANRYLSYNMRKIYNPIPAVEGVKACLGDKRSPLTSLLMVARFSYPHKDPYTVLKALAILFAKGYDELSLTFVGDGPEMQRVMEKCSAMGLSNHVTFAGYQPDPSSYYLLTDIVIHSSVAGEGLPTVMLEAMAYGKPVVATDSRTGPREILGDNEYGLLCGVKDADGMAAAIESLITDETKYNYYSSRALERVKAFSPSISLSDVESFLSSLICDAKDS